MSIPKVSLALDQKIALGVAAMAAIVMFTCVTLLVRKEREAASVARADIAGALEILNGAPPDGDFEILIPARSTQGDMAIARINGQASVKFPPTPTDLCMIIVMGVQPGEFGAIEVQTASRSSRIHPDRKSGMEVAAACGQPFGRSENVQVALMP